MFGEAATRQFNEKKLDYAKVSLYKIVTADVSLAQELVYQNEGEISRWVLDPDVAANVFGAPAHTVIGPIAIGEEYGLFLVDEFIAPQMMEAIHRSICDRLFYDWLDKEITGLEP